MKKKLALLIASLFLLIGTAWAQAPVATPAEAITGLLNRIGGNGAADLFEVVIDANLAENGKDVFVITSQSGKPCIKGNTQLSVATGINWYLNHYAHINLTWNNLTTDLSKVTLPVPGSEEKHVCNTTYRYNFNTCTFSYSMAFWTWERWQKEIDWMALHGINAPLNLVGLDVVTRKFLRELGVSENDINAYIAGPGFIAWFAMNNLEGWGGTINADDVTMNGNPDWWYTRQEQLCRNMLQRMRELGMQPVIPGFSGQVPNCIVNYSINGFSSGDVVNNGTWAGGYTRPDILKPNTTSYQTFATVYYKHLHEVMGVSELYSIDPFHEGSLPSGVTNATCYPNIMAELDKHFGNVEQSVKDSYKVTKSPSWMIQYWQGVPQSGAFTAMKNAGYTNRFIGLDLFADNIYADNAAKWRTNYYDTCPYVYCMLHNFGGRSGMHGRLETTMDGYFQALAKNNNMQGIGATPEGTETNPILYDMLFELPWMDPAKRPTADEWLVQYNQARYGTANEKTLEALKLLKKSVWDCKVNQQGTSEAVILARPNWTVNSVSSWSTSNIYWDTQDILEAADLLVAAEKSITSTDGVTNYNYDVMDVVRQAMVDYAAELLPLINAAKNDDAEYTRLYQLYLRLMLDLDEMLSYDENFKLERWTSLARNIANEVSGTTDNDRNWLEWNARTQITVWSKGNTDLHDYSNRCWSGLIKDFHYERWKKFFESKGASYDWYSNFEYPWTVDFTKHNYSTVTIPNDKTATQKAVETFGKYFGRVKGANKNYIFPMGITRKATKSDVIPEVYRGQTVDLPLEIGKNVTITSVWVDLNNDGAKGNGETLTATNNQVAIPADAKIGKTTAQVVYSDGTDITFNLALIEDINDARTVTAVAGANGSVAIEGTNELSITNAEAVKMTATANTGYNFENWTDEGGNVVSNDNPYIYYGKDAATFTANFIQDKWGVPTEDKGDWSDNTVKTSFVNELTFAYYNREPETIYEATAAPENLFNTIPQIINVPQGASFDVTWSDDGSNGLKYCCLSAYIDLNADGDFTDEGELLKVAGTKGAQDMNACEGKINVVLPYDAPLGITHMRIRFDGAWKNNGYNATTKSYDAKAQLNRMCYELIINVTEGSNKAAHVIVESNNDAWGTAEVWTDETPGWTASNEWDVSASIPVQMKATKASEDVEFLGWYDHYGRLLTTELQYKMLAREDATYTARFRKALEIDGWQFEYRTEPGSELNVKAALANGVMPEVGKTYYIYAPTNYNSVSATRYLYDNNGTLSTNTSAGGNNYIWTCIVNNDNTYSFQNASGKFLAEDSNHYLSVGATPAKYYLEDPTTTGLALKNAADYSGGKYMVTKHDGSAFNRNGDKTNGEWCSDYVFTEVTYPEVVVLTNVRQSGDHDLDIPETVEILGEQCKIVGFDNNLFKNNKDLWTISLPSTIEEMSNNKVFEGVVKGKGANAANEAGNYITTDLGTTCAAGEDWSISLTIEDNGNNFNQYGSALIATGNAPMNSTYGNGFQLYLQAGGGLVVKTDADSDANKLTNLTKGSKFRIDIVYTHANTQLVVTATPLTSVAALAAARSTYSTRVANSLTLTQDMSDFSVISHAIPEGVNITKLEVRKGTEPDPFEGCTNLLGIEVADGCESYYVSEGTLYTAGGTDLHELADADKEAGIRGLGELIGNTQALMDEIALSVDPVGKATGLPLTTTQGQDFYVSSNADQNTGGGSNDGGGIAALVDNNEGTYFHTRWGGTVVNEPHYIQVDLGASNLMNNFKFTYKPRNGSPAPTAMTVYGSNDGTNFTDILAKINSGLPAHNSGKTYESAAIDSKQYRYLRFTVTGSAGPGGNNYGGQYFFGMLEFDLFKLTSVVEVATEYKDVAKITNDEAANVYDNLVNALYVYNNGGTADELQAAYDVLKPLYDAVNDKKNALEYINQLNELIANTDALINKIATSVDPVGKATEIALSPTQGDAYYIWCSNPHIGGNDGAGGIAALLDEKSDTYLHTNWDDATKSDTHDYLQIDNVNPVELANFKIAGQQRNGASDDYPKNIEISGSNNGTDWSAITTVTGLPNQSGATWSSGALTSNAKYTYYKFVVKTHNNYNQTSSVTRPYFHMAKFDLFKLTSVVEVAEVYKNLAGISNDEAANLYDNLVNALYVYNNGGTIAELEATLTALRTAYEALNAKQGKVLNGVYNINFNGAPTFVAYSPSMHENWGLTGATEGYRLFDATTDNTEDRYKTIQDNAIAAKVSADELFVIVPNSAGTGFTISAQGLYMRTTSYTSQWCVQSFDTNEANAGVYEIEQVSEGVFKLKSIRPDSPWQATEYVNDWGPVFGNDLSTKPNLSTFSFTPITEYTLTVPASGVTTLCLPFNVVLPEGVDAYDINNVEKQVLVSGEGLLQQLAVAGDIVQAGTPMIIKAAQGDHTFAITMESEGAKTSLDGSVLSGNYVKQTLAFNAEHSKYVLNGKVWEKIDKSTELGANNCWIEVATNAIDYDYNIDMEPKFVEIDGWKFRYEPATNGIMLTDAAQSGNGDLVIPSSFKIEDKDIDVVAISPDFLHGNKKLTSIEFPATMVNLGFRKVEPMFGDDTTVYEGAEGDGGVYEGNQATGEVNGAHRKYVFPTDPVTSKPFMVESSFAWRLTLDVTIDNPDLNFNNYGSAIVSTNANSLADSYVGDMQIYMKAGHKDIMVKIDNADDRYRYTLPELDANGKETGELVVHNHFKFELEHDGSGGYQVVIYYDDGRAKMYNISASEGAIVNNFDCLYYSLPKGIRVKVKVEKLYSEGLFVGCTNLTKIEVDENNPTFMGCDHGVLYDKNQYYVMRIPEGETGHHFEIPSKVVRLYPGAVHGVTADVVLHSNPQIGVVTGHEDDVKNVNFYLSLDDIDNTITENETGYGGARDFISANNNHYLQARYKRTPLAKGVYGTLCLPFDIKKDNAIMKKYDFYEFTSANETSLIFTQVTELEYNKPYLYKLKDSVEEGFNIDRTTGCDVFQSAGEVDIKTLAKFDISLLEDDITALGAFVNNFVETNKYSDKAFYYYKTSAQAFYQVTKKLTYRPYRAFFVVNNVQAAQAAPRLSLQLLDGTVTDIDASLVEGMEAPEYYDLSGRRVLNPISSGIYVVNGKKVFIK